MRKHSIYMSARGDDGARYHFTGCGLRLVGPLVTDAPQCENCNRAARTRDPR